MLPKNSLGFATMALVCAMLAPVPASAQAADDKIPVYRLEPREAPDVPVGRVAMVAGTTTAIPDRFFVENLHMLVPVSVTVRAADAAAPVRVRLTKSSWDEALREGTTANGEQVQFKLRTQGEFQIAVDSPRPGAEYKMVVWVGPDIVPETSPIIVPTSEFDGGTPRWIWWVAGGIGALLLLVLAFVFGKRSRQS